MPILWIIGGSIIPVLLLAIALESLHQSRLQNWSLFVFTLMGRDFRRHKGGVR